MGKIFCIIGKSSSGKDTIYKKLLQCHQLDLKTIVPYTTRPIRVGEQEGVERTGLATAELFARNIFEDGECRIRILVHDALGLLNGMGVR